MLCPHNSETMSDNEQSLYETQRTILEIHWEVYEADPERFISNESISIVERLCDLYDLLMFFIDREEYEKCAMLQDSIDTLKEQADESQDED